MQETIHYIMANNNSSESLTFVKRSKKLNLFSIKSLYRLNAFTEGNTIKLYVLPAELKTRLVY